MDGFAIQMEVKGFDPSADEIDASMTQAFETGVRQLFDRVEEVWREKASITLDRSRQKYLDGLSFERSGTETLDVTVEGFLPTAIERGSERFDMKDGLLKGRLSRVIPLDKENEPFKFRTVSRTQRGWWHPGIEARAIHQQVFTETNEKLIPEIFGPLMGRVQV